MWSICDFFRCSLFAPIIMNIWLYYVRYQMKSVISWLSNVGTQNDGYLSNVEDCKVSISVESPSNWWIDLMLLLDSFEETSFFSFWFSCDWLWVGNNILSWFGESCLWFVWFRSFDDAGFNNLFTLWCWRIASFTALSVAFLPWLRWKMKNTYEWTEVKFSLYYTMVCIISRVAIIQTCNDLVALYMLRVSIYD